LGAERAAIGFAVCFALPFRLRFGIRNPIFYVFVGFALALLGAAIFVSATPHLTWYTDSSNPRPEIGFWHEVFSITPVFAWAGAIAGLTFWLAAGRLILKRTT
jgi:hypothetical protein